MFARSNFASSVCLAFSMAMPAMADTEGTMFREWIGNAFLSKDVHGSKPGLEVRRQDHGSFKLNRSAVDAPLQIGNQKYSHGLGTHSVSEIVVCLPSPAKKFSAQIGINNDNNANVNKGSVVFVVEAGGKEIFRSGICRGGEAPVPVSLDIPLLSTFILRVLDAGDGPAFDQSDWAEAKVQLENGKELLLDELLNAGGNTGILTKVPFSFVYGDKPSSEFISGWKHEVKSDPPASGKQQHVITYSDPVSGLELRCDLTTYTDRPAVEWMIFLKNKGTADTPVIKDLKPLDMEVIVPDGDVTLHRSYGSTATATDFLPNDEIVYGPTSQIDLAPNGGRSSDGTLPFFNLEWNKGGLVAAVGWSGQWAAQLQRKEKNLRLLAGQQTVGLRLHPGEEIRTPRILLVSWEGSDYMLGNNVLRRLLLDYYVPRLEGKINVPPVTATAFFMFNWGNEVTEENQKAVMPSIASAGAEGYWMDAGWFEGGWPAGAGSWIPKKEAFPNGLKPLGDEAHKLGLKFVLWFEPERVTKGSRIDKEHPEWVMHWQNDAAGGGYGGGLFNMGNPDACKWMTDYLSECISKWGVDILRIDFNIVPLPFWQAADVADRQGMSEIRYIEGLYAMWDALLKKHPGLAIDNCASGGRRIDLETISRSYVLSQSDTEIYGSFPVYDQGQNQGLSMYVPLHAGFVWAFDTYTFRSIATTGCCICLSKDKKLDESARRMFDEAKSLRPYYLGDYYPLFMATRSEVDWCGWQYDRPDMDSGFFVVFRRSKSPYSSADISLRGLDQNASYELTDKDTGKVIRKSGKELSSGLNLQIETKPSCVLIQYKKI